MEPLSYSRKTLLKLLRKDSHRIWQSFKSLFHGFGQDKLAKTLFQTGIVRIPNFIESETSDELNHSLNELIEKYTENKGNMPCRISGINQLIPLIREIPDDSIQSLLFSVTGKRIERFQNCARLRNDKLREVPFRTGRLSPIVFTAYLLVKDMDESEAPVALIPGSHSFSLRPYFQWLKNTLRNNSKAPLEVVAPSKVQKMSGNKGDLIILNQNTYHRKLAPSNSSTIYHLEFEYMVITRLSDLHQAARENWAQITEKPLGQTVGVGLEPS